MNKKLQVFVSSTYTDLVEERQAAVEAILDAGHIPAGMELFKAGNESQLKTIYKWIDESDVYMLILGGRYGTIEPKTNKSYTQIEYEYAASKGIPIFAVVLSEPFLKNKMNVTSKIGDVIEQKEPEKYKEFKDIVMSKIIREADDCKDIKLAIHSTLNEFMNDYNLTGWVRNTDENDTVQMLKDNSLLIKENNVLNKQIHELKEKLRAKENAQFGRYSFEELITIFRNKTFVLPEKYTCNGKKTIDALEFFIFYYDDFVTGITNRRSSSDEEIFIFYNIAPYYFAFEFMERVKLAGTAAQRIHSTKLAGSFYAMCEAKNIVQEYSNGRGSF
ncbi:MAG: DUF4062 domain-containing protein [Acetatifactor sp.]|nr:DUF4062 domain-containing protein [Acetatifactor sp.]